jgi:SAM-dependent methyltransferase
MERKILLLGAGNSRQKKVFTDGRDPAWGGKLVTIDMDPNCGADVVWDLELRPLPFADGEFDEIHAYDCLEHWGRQGDWRAWFDEMGEYHRLLKPGGEFAAVVPVGGDAFADPGHTRVFSLNYFTFLSQDWYSHELARGAPVTDYRWYWKKNFRVVRLMSGGEPAHHVAAVLAKD